MHATKYLRIYWVDTWFLTVTQLSNHRQSLHTTFALDSLTKRGVCMTNTIPETGFLRLWQIVGCKRRKVAPIIPISRTSWFNGCKSGKYPAPIKLGERTTVWRAEDIRQLIEERSAAKDA